MLLNENLRITPACAGKTLPEQANYLHQRDHPRMCGKNKCIMFSWDSYTRITPACAGKAYERLQSPQSDQDHPRVCGKNFLRALFRSSRPGSPPHVREKLISSNSSSRNTRITPACAGKTQTETSLPCLIRDHPRVCGKNYCLLRLHYCFTGSPPRVREKLYTSAKH